MITKILRPNKYTYIRCANIIQACGVVAFPTETVYGLGANAYYEKAVEKIFKAKGRPSDNPLIVHIADVADIEKVAYVTPLAEKIIKAFMPGPITVVLNKKRRICSAATAGLDTVGVRIPSNEYAREFFRFCNVPIAAPSANTSSRPSPTEALHVYEDLKGRIPAIIDGGKCDIGIESTVVDARGDCAVILRPGDVTYEQILAVTGCVEYATQQKTVLSPGVKYRHYAPRCPCVLIESCNAEFFKSIYEKEEKQGNKPVILCYNSIVRQLENFSVISLGDNDKEAAAALYGALRNGEKQGGIIIMQSCDKSTSYSLYNRMIKSCGGNIITG